MLVNLEMKGSVMFVLSVFFILVSLGWAHGDTNSTTSSESPLSLRELVHPANLTIQSQERTHFNDTDYRGFKPLSKNATLPEPSNGTRGSKAVQADDADDGRLRCYVCSWSIMGHGYNASTNINTCSTNHFVPERADRKPCDHGCETKAFRKTKKDGNYFCKSLFS